MEIFEKDTGFEILKYLNNKELINICEEMGLNCYQIYAYILKKKFNVDTEELSEYEVKERFYSLIYEDLESELSPIIISKKMQCFMGLKHNITNKKYYYNWWIRYISNESKNINTEKIEPDKCVRKYFDIKKSFSLNEFIKFLNSNISRRIPKVALGTLLEWSEQ